MGTLARKKRGRLGRMLRDYRSEAKPMAVWGRYAGAVSAVISSLLIGLSTYIMDFNAHHLRRMGNMQAPAAVAVVLISLMGFLGLIYSVRPENRLVWSLAPLVFAAGAIVFAAS